MADPPSLNIPGAYDALSSMLGRPINPTPKGQYPLYWAGCNNQTFCVEKLFLKVRKQRALHILRRQALLKMSHVNDFTLTIIPVP